jgi:tRNA A22 N-methylase
MYDMLNKIHQQRERKREENMHRWRVIYFNEFYTLRKKKKNSTSFTISGFGASVEDP